MALRTINLGNVANDGTGDDLREAFEKVIFNFAELDARTPETTTAVNLGGGQGLFANKNDAELQFKSLVGGTNATLTADANTITIDVDAGVTQFIVATESGSLTVTENTTVTFEGGPNSRGQTLIATERVGDSIKISTSALSALVDDPNPTLSAGLNAAGYNLASVGDIDAGTVSALFIGNLTGLVHGIDIRDLNEYRDPNNWNFGSIAPTTVTTIYDWIFESYDIDFGTISGIQPNKTLDFGAISI